MEIRMYTSLLEKVIRKGTSGMSEEETEQMMKAHAKFANNDNDQLMQAIAQRLHSSRVPSLGELQDDFYPCMNRAIFDLFVPENVRVLKLIILVSLKLCERKTEGGPLYHLGRHLPARLPSDAPLLPKRLTKGIQLQASQLAL